MGCFVVFNKSFLIDSGVDYLIENKDKSIVPDLIDRLSLERKNSATNKMNKGAYQRNTDSLIHTRALIKIQDGCEQGCSYCVVPMVRGGYRSVQPADIIYRIKNFEEKGFEEVVLTGIHIGKYGIDLHDYYEPKDGEYEVKNLFDLLNKIINSTGIKRIRLSSIEICEIDSGIIDLICKNKRIAPHLHIPLQSGSNKILRLMERPYTREYFLGKVGLIKEKVPHISITTDVMVGFPGEEEEDFLDTVDLVRRVSFSKLHVFKYSPRPCTRASKMKDHVPENIKTYRSRYLREIGDKLRKSYIEKNIEETLEVLVEKIDLQAKVATGISQNYIRVFFPLNGSLPNKLEEVKRGKLVEIVAKSTYKEGLWGQVVKI